MAQLDIDLRLDVYTGRLANHKGHSLSRNEERRLKLFLGERKIFSHSLFSSFFLGSGDTTFFAPPTPVHRPLARPLLGRSEEQHIGFAPTCTHATPSAEERRATFTWHPCLPLASCASFLSGFRARVLCTYTGSSLNRRLVPA